MSQKIDKTDTQNYKVSRQLLFPFNKKKKKVLGTAQKYKRLPELITCLCPSLFSVAPRNFKTNLGNKVFISLPGYSPSLKNSKGTGRQELKQRP